MDEKMQGLKALVIFMGILIVIGMAVLAYGLVSKFGNKAEQNKAVQGSSLPAIAAPTVPGVAFSKPAFIKPFGHREAYLPAGAEIFEFIAHDQRLFILYQQAGKRAIKVIGLAEGLDLGTIHLDARHISQ